VSWVQAVWAGSNIADACKQIEIPGVMWFSVRDDLITKRIDTWDSLTFLKQTGQHD